jgi:hypothetical protein
MSNAMTLSTIHNSNLPKHTKSDLIRRLMGHGGAIAHRAKAHTGAVIEGFTTAGVSAAVGGALGAVHARHGLDVAVSKAHVPVDAALAAAALIYRVVDPNDDVLKHAANTTAAAAASVFTFRKMYGFYAASASGGQAGRFPNPFPKMAAHGEDFAGDFGDESDPILAAARAL